MQFKRFLQINDKENNQYIIFKNNKILYESDSKTFLLESKYLNIDIDNSIIIGIAESENKIYAVDISNSVNDINIGCSVAYSHNENIATLLAYTTLNEYSTQFKQI